MTDSPDASPDKPGAGADPAALAPEASRGGSPQAEPGAGAIGESRAESRPESRAESRAESLRAEAFDGPVVGIGASAGGLDALERLFAALPPRTGAAWVVIQHLSPDHKSMMDNLLARYTAMPVKVVTPDMALGPNAVFLIPPGKEMRVGPGGRLQLTPKPEHGLSLPIDVFFNSLAENVADRAIAVVLSGTGSDGSRGIPAVNAAGGFVFAQDPATAKFDGMPRAAIATGFVDAVASAEGLAERLVQHLAGPRPDATQGDVRAAMRGAGPVADAAAGAVGLTPLDAILELMLADSGVQFRDYKPTTVQRRIERRMQVRRAPGLADYRRLLAESPDERALLRRELLIPVSRFFRDSEAFEQLATDVIEPMLRRVARGDVPAAEAGEGGNGGDGADGDADSGRRPGEPPTLRLWVACCASGEEAYSMAMLVAEAAARLRVAPAVKIFATDVEPAYLEQASVGQYPDTIAAEVSRARLERFFVEQRGGYAVRPEIRQMVIFARHNLLADPPFTRMGLVSCRNALIYLQPAAQERALRRLQYALVPQGVLMLGSSESLGALHRDFAPLPGRHKLYRLLRRERTLLGLDAPGRHAMSTAARDRTALAGPRTALLKLPAGGGPAQQVRLELRTQPGEAPALLVSVESPVAAAEPGTPGDGAALLDTQRTRIEALEAELELTQASLQATIEELETANEELQATNEELMASNEELQSTNEELQSVNEELYTVNAEFQEKVDVLAGVNADLENIVRATGIPTLFVDADLHLTRFTPELAQIFKVRESDRGRSIEDFAHRLDYPELFADLRRTLREGRVTEREVRSLGGADAAGHGPQWWLARIQPYAARGSGGARAVMTFFDVTSLKDALRLQAVIDSLPEHVAVVDPQGTVTLVNAAWRRFAIDNGDPQLAHTGPGSNYLKVCAAAALHDGDARAAYEGLSAVLSGSAPVFTLQYPCHTARRRLWFVMHVAPVAHPGGGAVVSHIDVTSWVLDGADKAAPP